MVEWTRLSLCIKVSQSVDLNQLFESDLKEIKLFHHVIGFLVTKKTFSRIYGYSTASTDDAAFIIGGNDVYDTIAEFRNDQWRNLGSLNKGRFYHGSITVGQETMIIGGDSNDHS